MRRIARMAIEVARASAIAQEGRRQAGADPAYTDYWAVPIKKDPFKVPLDDKIAFLLKVNEAVAAEQGRLPRPVDDGLRLRVEVPRDLARAPTSSRRCGATAGGYTVSARGKTFKTRTFSVPPRTAGYEVIEEAADARERRADCRRGGRARLRAAGRPPGLKDLILTPSHAMLTIHEIIAHPTELDRIMGYEANYAGTSFIKLADVGKLKYGSKLFNVTADRTMPGGMCTVGYDDDGVKTQEWPLVREGVLVGLQTNRETAHFMGENGSRAAARSPPRGATTRSCACRTCTSTPGRRARRRPSEIIADTKDGILIDGRGSYSIDQQRYNGQFGGDAFWEVKNGKVTRMVSDVTYNAITTDFWTNLDAISGKDSWRMYGTTGDAKGQPVQINHPSHGSPYLRIKKVMVGAAYS